MILSRFIKIFMDNTIKNILKKVEEIQGFTPQETEILLILGNDDLFNEFIEKLQKEVPAEEFEKVKTLFEAEKYIYQESQKTYQKEREALDAKEISIVQENIEILARTNPTALSDLNTEISNL